MNVPTVLLSAILLTTSPGLAEDANPFVVQETKPAPTEASGESFVNVVEHILVPSDQLDAWLEKHPLTDDASGLRAVAQIWIEEKTATLDHTAISVGTAGREFGNHSTLEQIYATEYEPPQPGEWPFPTAFETRNQGYSSSGGAGVEQGALLLWARMSFCGMMRPGHSWNELAERTRQPDDIFIPRFRSIEAERAPQDGDGPVNSADPFAEPVKESPGLRAIRFTPGKVHLAARADDTLPEPPVSARMDMEVKPAAKDPHRPVRLIFFRGAVLPRTAPPPAGAVNRHLSIKLFRVKHKVLSDWIVANELTTIPDSAWNAVGDWLAKGDAEPVESLTQANTAGSQNKIQNIAEVIYPTEWEKADEPPPVNGKKAQPEFSTASAFETRNAGIAFQSDIIADPQGPLLRFEFERVLECGKSVHHRIFRDGEWKADVTFPIFATNAWISELRVKDGRWMLIGSGADIDAKGHPDPKHAVLAFVKVE